MTDIKQTTDIDLLMSIRMEVIDSVFGHQTEQDREALAEANRRYYRKRLHDGSHLAFVAYSDGTVCGSGAICLHDEMPSPDNPSGRCAYIMNVYVRHEYRKHGIASQIMHRLVTKAKMLGADKIYLEATDMASTLYHHLGFRDMHNMMKYEDKDN